MRRRTSRRIRPLLAGLAVAAAVGLAAPQAALAAPAPTTVRGWDAAPTGVTAGGTFRVTVRTSGAPRVVRLERVIHGTWHLVDRVVTAADGRAALAWRVPARAGRLGLRVHVTRTATAHWTVTPRRVVVVGAASALERTRQQLFTLVNRARATARTCGTTRYPAVPALVRSAPLDRAAGDYATLMATKGFFSHTGPDGSTPGTRIAKVGIRNVAWAENIAAGQSSPATVMDAWLKSEGHCENLMSAAVHRIGFGYATSSSSTYGRYWVQDFAG